MTEDDQQVMKSIAIVTLAIAAIGVVAFFIAQSASEESNLRQQTSQRAMQAMEERVQPVGKVSVAAAAEEGAAKAARSGGEIVQAACAACHSGGIPGAPVIGSKGDWEARVATGMDTMLASVINGKGIMPPRGGGDFSDEELKSAIQAMLGKSGF